MKFVRFKALMRERVLLVFTMVQTKIGWSDGVLKTRYRLLSFQFIFLHLTGLWFN